MWRLKLWPWRGAWERWLLSDEMGIMILGVLGEARGISYLPPAVDPARSPAHGLEHLFSPPVWGAVWMLAGLACLASVAWRRAQPAAVGVIVGLHFLWGCSFLSIGNRGWVTSLAYYSVCALAFWAFARGRRNASIDPPEIPKEG